MDSNDFNLVIIDDEKDVRDSLKQMFSIEGFNVFETHSAKVALNILSGNFGGVVISDIRMPEMDGLIFLSEIRKFDKLMPVVLITGHGDIKLAVKSLKLGATDFLEKPFDPKELLEKVKLLYSQRKEAVRMLNYKVNVSLKEMTDAFEKERIIYHLKKHDGMILAVMKDLKLPRRTLNEKMAKYGINRKSYLSN